MNASNAAIADSAASAIPEVVPLAAATPSSPYALEHLSDSELFDGTRRLIARSNHHLAALLAHLAEVEARGIHRLRACSSLYTYCIYELRLSADMAYRHARAAKIVRRFPVLFDRLAAGEIHLTGLLLLGPHLTEENHLAVLLRAKHRTKREIEKLVRQLDPLPDVPASVDPLGPVGAGLSMNNPSWQDFVTSTNVVRELKPGQRPQDWMDSASDTDSESVTDAKLEAQSEPVTPAPVRRAEPEPRLMPQRYKVQFTANQEYVELLERARDLLSHAVPNRSIEEVHLRAMRAFVSALEKRRYATKERLPAMAVSEVGEPELREPDPEPAVQPSAPVPGGGEANGAPRGVSEFSAEPSSGVSEFSAEPSSGDPRQRGRYTPAEVRRSVRKRDGARCSYVDEHGRRCGETSLLEIHHRDPFARGGPATRSNMTIYCRSHNALAAEQDFGRAHIDREMGRG